VREWAADAPVVAFAGDDAGDLAAFAALAELREQGRTTFSIAVGGPESPRAVLAAADAVLAGPAQLEELLVGLAAAS
jgi:trehalose 6-phosphate phosphatase